MAIAYEAIARCSLAQADVMQQWLRHIAALVDNAPPAVQASALELVQRVLARATRSSADPADVQGWHAAALSLGLGPTRRQHSGGDDLAD